MRELTLDDAFWRDALAALREPSGSDRLERTWPEYAGLVRDLAASAREGRCLIGGRPATAGKNPRLFLVLTAAALAREGVETLYLDLSSELRWLEMLTGEDLKEGLVDHLQYDVPLERCVRGTAFGRLSVLTGGAYFLAGSPLEDAPAFRAALETLRGRHDAVVAAFPHPFDAAESAGVTALCDAWIAIEEGEVEAPLTGSERAVVRLAGDPQAAWDLARLSSAFLGPLPSVLASGGPGEAPETDRPPAAPPESGAGRPGPGAFPGFAEPDTGETAGEGASEPVEDAEEVAFLRAFEAVSPPPPREGDAEGPGPGPDLGAGGDVEHDGEHDVRHDVGDGGADGGEDDDLPWSPPSRRRRARSIAAPPRPRRGIGRGGAVAIGAAALVVALIAIGYFADLFDPLWAGSGEEPEWAIAMDEPVDEEGAGTMVALDAPSDTGGVGGVAEDGEAVDPDPAGDAADPVAIEGEPAPFSLHVGSYQSPESGGRVVSRLEAVGQTAFLAPVDLGERGLWYRVYAGAFADSASAGRTLESVLGRDLVEEGAVRRTPWAFRVGAHESRDAAEAEVADLVGDGISAYAIGDGPSVVWVGAFRSRDEAATMATALEEAGVEATLTERERPR